MGRAYPWLVNTTTSFGSGNGRPKDDPSLAAFRKIALLIDLIREKSIDTRTYCADYGVDKRSLQRDLRQLRTIGEARGFTLSSVKDGRVTLTSFERRPHSLDREASSVDRLIAQLGAAFGEPLARELGLPARTADSEASFIRFTAPVIAAGSRVAGITAALRDAMQAEAGRARVRFTYRGRDGVAHERTVEPAHVLVRSGRWFLVGYDTARRAWRTFALDAIVGVPQRAGTLATVRTVPAMYDNDDAVGFIKGEGAATAVTVEVSAALAASVASRVWQRRQQVEMLADGRARLTLYAWDLGEVVRWAFGFAPEAVVTAPREAVALAADLAAKLGGTHAVAANDTPQ